MRGPFVIRPASIPSPAQGVWHLGPIPIRAYALCLIAGFLVAAYVLWRRPAATEALQTRRSHHPRDAAQLAGAVRTRGLDGG